MQKEPGEAEPNYRVGLCYLRQGRLGEAYVWLQRAAHLNGRRQDIQGALADVSMAIYTGDARHPSQAYETARRAVADLQQLAPDSFDALRLAGELALIDKKPASVELLSKARELRPFEPSAAIPLFYAFVENGRRADAEQLAWSLINHDKTCKPAYFALYRDYMSQGETVKASEVLSREVDTDPSDARAILRLAQLYQDLGKSADVNRMVRSGRSADAVRELELAESHDSLANAASYERKIAAVLVTQGQVRQAIQRLDALILKHPDDHPSRQMRATALLRSGDQSDVDRAIRDLEYLLQHGGRDATTEAELGEAFLANGNLSQAISELQQALQSGADPLSTNLLLARACIYKKDPAASEIYAGRALKIDSNNSKAHLLHATALMGQGKTSEPAKELQGVVQKSPTDDEARLQLATLLITQGQANEADKLLSYFANTSGTASTWKRVAEVRILEGRPREAEVALLRALSFNENDSQAHTALRDVETRLSKANAAEQQYRKAIAIQPSNAPALNNLAFLLAKEHRDLDEAQTFAERAVKAQPDQAAFRDTLGFVYLQQKMLDRAVLVFRDLATEYPKNPGYRGHLELALAQKRGSAVTRNAYTVPGK